jgi:hypothetical protein
MFRNWHIWGREVVQSLETLQRELRIDRPPVHFVGGTGEPAFNTGWANYGGGTYEDALFYKTNEGLVYISGLVKRTSGSLTTIFTLPEGFRPAKQLAFLTMSYTTWTQIDVQANGEVVDGTGGDPSYSTSLDGISFIVSRI